MPKNFVGQPCCAVVRNFPVAKNFMDKGGGGEYQDFPSINFSLTVPKKYVGQLCCAVFQKCSGSEKVYG